LQIRNYELEGITRPYAEVVVENFQCLKAEDKEKMDRDIS